MAPKASGKKAAPAKQKTPAKKAKKEEEEAVAAVADQEEAGAAEDVDEDADVEAEEGGDEEAAGASDEGPAAHTRSKEGGSVGVSTKGAAGGAVPQPTIVDILLGDHRDTVALLKHAEELSASGDKQLLENLTDTIAITIRLHSQAEFEVLYPLMAKKLGDEGKKLQEQSIQEHSAIEEDLLKALEMRKEGGDSLAGTMKEVMDLFVKHMGEEENEMVPKLLAAMDEEEQIEVGASFMAAKAKANLMPQPVAK